MGPSIHDYLIDQTGPDWTRALSTWSWLLPSDVTVWLVSRVGDLFLVLADGSVHMLDVGAGTLVKVAQSRDDFCSKIDEPELAAEWLMVPLVDRLIATGVRLTPGQCFGFVTPPVLGGQYVTENVRPISAADYLSAYGSIHAQLKDLPNGAHVVLKVSNRPS